MSEYGVEYKISVIGAEETAGAIRKITEAAVSAEKASSRFDLLSKKIGKVNSALTHLKNKELTISTKVDLGQIEKLQASLKTLKSGAKINIGCSFPKTEKQFESFKKSLKVLNDTKITPTANTSKAVPELEKLFTLIKDIKANSNIKINASANTSTGAGTGTTSGSSTARAAAGGTVARRINRRPSMNRLFGSSQVGGGPSMVGDFAKSMGVMYGMGALFSGINSVFKDAAEYNNTSETTRNILKTHDNRSDFEQRFQQASHIMREVGMETKYTAPQVAEAGKYMAMAGLGVDDIKEGIRPIANIALIGDTDLGETSDLMTNVMTGYQIPFTKMNRVADVLTMTFTKTNTTLTSLAESYKYAGTVAHQAGLSFEQTSAMIGVLGDAGIKGSLAGTNLRMILMNLLNPTKKAMKAWDTVGVKTRDAHGNLRNINDILLDLNSKMKEFSKTNFVTLIQRMFRVTAAPGALALIQNAHKVQEVTDLNYNNSNGVSAKIADAKKNDIQGLWYQMTSAFTETGMRQFEKMQGTIKGFLHKMIDIMKSPDLANALSLGLHGTIVMLDSLLKVGKIIGGIVSVFSHIPFSKEIFSTFIEFQMFSSVFGGLMRMVLSMKSTIQALAVITSIKRVILAIRYIKTMLALSQGIGKFAAIKSGWSLAGKIIEAQSGAAGAPGGILGRSRSLWSLTGLASLSTTAMVAIGGIAALGAAASFAAYKLNQAHDRDVTINNNIKKLNLGDKPLYYGNTLSSSSNYSNAPIINGAIENQRRDYKRRGIIRQKALDKNSYNLLYADRGGTFADVMWNSDATDAINTIYSKYIAPNNKYVNSKDRKDKKYFDNVNGNGINNRSIVTADESLDEIRRYAVISNIYGKGANSSAAQKSINQIAQLYNSKEAETNFESVRKKALEIASQYDPSKKEGLINAKNIDDQNLKNIDVTKTSQYYSGLYQRLLAAANGDDLTGYTVGLHNLKNGLKRYSDSWYNNVDKVLSATKMTFYDQQGRAHVLSMQFQKGNPIWNSLYSQLSKLHIKFGDSLQNHLGILDAIEQKMRGVNFSGLLEKINEEIEIIENMLNRTSEMLYKLDPKHNKLKFFSEPGKTKLPYKQKQTRLLTFAEASRNNDNKDGNLSREGLIKKYGIVLGSAKYNQIIDKKKKEYGLHDKDTDNKKNIINSAKSVVSGIQKNTGAIGGKAIGDGSAKGKKDGKSGYENRYRDTSAAPKQVIVNIGSLMKIDKQMIDMNDKAQSKAIQNIKEQMASALLDVVSDFTDNLNQ